MKKFLVLLALLSGCSDGESSSASESGSTDGVMPGVEWKKLNHDPYVGYCTNPETGERVYIMIGYRKGGIFVAPPAPKKE